MIARRRTSVGDERAVRRATWAAVAVVCAGLVVPRAARADETKAKLTLIGGLTFGTVYLFSLPLALLDPGEPGAAKLIPVVGPAWGAACAFGASCGGVVGHPAIGVGESLMAAGQLTGLTLLTVGLLMREPSPSSGDASSGLRVGATNQGTGVTWMTPF